MATERGVQQEGGPWPLMLSAGRFSIPDRARRIAALAARCRGSGLNPEVVCEEGAEALWELGCEAGECGWLARPWVLRHAARSLMPKTKAGPPRLIHALEVEQAEAALALARCWGVPYIVSIEDFGRLPGRVGGASDRWCRGLVVSTEEEAEGLRGERPDRARVVRVVPFSIEPKPEDLVHVEAERPSRIPVVGCSARWDGRDGVPVLMKAARMLLDEGRDLELLLAGEGPLEDKYRRLAEELSIIERVTFAREPAADDPFWEVLTLYCQPAVQASSERSLAIALSAGLACVASDVEGLSGLMQYGRFGELLPAGHPGALSEALARHLDRRGEGRARRAEAREWALGQFDADRTFEQLRGIYEEAVDPPRIARTGEA